MRVRAMGETIWRQASPGGPSGGPALGAVPWGRAVCIVAFE